ncbi:MAG: hypothetical protein K6A70_04180 [Erysipelotrichaceae bacterium]|nr:hypothetical protein [Erysipelotrichaceae bacterium]
MDEDMMFRNLEYRFPSMVSCFLEGIINRTNSSNVFIPFAKGDDVVLCKQWGIPLDYYMINIRERERVEKATGVKALDKMQDISSYDLVFSDLPFFPINPRNEILKETLCVMEKMSDTSLAVFTYANAITASSAGQKWIKSVESKGIFVNAVIDLPSGLYRPLTQVESRLVIFSKVKKEKVFFAKIKEEKEIDTILDFCFGIQKSNSTGRLGAWFAEGEYPDYSSYENANRSERVSQELSKRFNGPLVSLESISIKTDAPRKDGFVDEVDGSVYIPKIGKSQVVTHISDFEIKNHNYFRLIVDENKMYPEYLAFILNSEQGVELRLKAMQEGTIPSLNKSGLLAINVPQTTLDFQAEILKLDSELNHIEQETNRLREKLHKAPSAYKSIKKEIKDINNRGDKFEQWIETLPYPIATILKNYQVGRDDEHKQNILLHFFEAYSIFECAILFGAFCSNQNESIDIGDVDSSFFEKASFGSWVKLNRAISNAVRKKLYDKDTMNNILDYFGTEEIGVIDALSNKDVCNILEEVCNYRNSWHGHSGITSEAGYSAHMHSLSNALDRFRMKVKDVYENIQLIQSIGLKKKGATFVNTVNVLTGSNSIFKNESFEGDALEDGKLYVRMLDTNRTIELPPFLLMGSTPSEEKNACYFYNRIEGNGSRYVSYHYENKPEIVEPDDNAFVIIKDFLDRKDG